MLIRLFKKQTSTKVATEKAVLEGAFGSLKKACYEQVMHNKDSTTPLSLTKILRQIVELMTSDVYRTRIGISFKPPRQHNTTIAIFKTFENYILRYDGICVDSLEMITQPAYQSQWHTFIQSFINGLQDYIRIAHFLKIELSRSIVIELSLWHTPSTA
uniref:Transposase n=1 Tax=Strongyloides venezuelensis TaxID=75913 RepID=A0A0K0EYQ3_STRVS